MTRYVVIALMNLLVVASIAVNAIIALVRGCNMDGTCSSGSSVFTWALAVGLGAAVIAGAALLARYVGKQRDLASDQNISILSMPAAAGTGYPRHQAAADDSDEAMLSRLARMSRVSDDAAAPVAQPDADAVAEAMADAPIPSLRGPEANSGEPAFTTGAAPSPPPAKSAPDLHLVVLDGERTGQRPIRSDKFDAASDRQIESGRYGWLFEAATGANAVQIRRDSGFPWCVAAISHICEGIVQFGPALKDTDILPEASAWCRVTAALPRNHILAKDDAAAFADWLNVGLRLVGRRGRIMIEMAMQRLEAEAVGDPVMAGCLPQPLRPDGPVETRPIARFG